MASIKPATGIVKMIDKATKPLRKISESFKKLGMTSDKTNKKLNKTQIAINNISKAQNRLNRTQAGVKRSTRDIGSQAVGVAALALSFKAALNPAIKFEQSMKDLEAVAFGASGATVDIIGNMKKLSEQAKKLGATTAFSATEAAAGQIFLAKAGFKTNQILSAMPGLLDLAAASGTDLARSSDILSDLLGAFGTSAKDTGKLVDILAAATSSANVDMETLFETLKVAAPVGIAAGQSIEGIVTATALLGNVGIKGSQAGTALKNAFVKLASPAAEGAKVLKELGIQVADSEGNMLPLQKIMLNLGKSMGKLSQVKRIKAFDAIFGKIAIAGAINLQKAVASGDFDKMLKNLEKSSGVAKNMANIRLDSTQGALTILTSSLEGVAITFGKILTPAVRGAAEVLSAMGEPLQKFIDNNKGAIAVIGGVAAGLLALKIATLAYTATLWLVSPAIMALKAALVVAKVAMIAFNVVAAINPLGAVVLAVGALITGIVLLTSHWDSLKATMSGGLGKVASFLGFGSDENEEAKNNRNQLSSVKANSQTLQNNSVNKNNAIINVNIANDKVKSVETEGSFETKAFVNAGTQQ